MRWRSGARPKLPTLRATEHRMPAVRARSRSVARHCSPFRRMPRRCCRLREAIARSIIWALLARLPKASALLPIAEKTLGSAASAFIAALSPGASDWNAAALDDIRASAEAWAAASRNAFALLAEAAEGRAVDHDRRKRLRMRGERSKCVRNGPRLQRVLEAGWQAARRQRRFSRSQTLRNWRRRRTEAGVPRRPRSGPLQQAPAVGLAIALNASALAASAPKTCGSAAIALIAALSLAKRAKDAALPAIRASAAAFEAASRNACVGRKSGEC